MQHPSWHALTLSDVTDRFKTDIGSGLAPDEAEQRLRTYGENTIRRAQNFWFVRLILEQVKSPLVWVLLVAGLATAFLGEWLDTIVISVALIVNVSVGAFQEGRASKVFETLSQSQRTEATVLRNGEKTVLASSYLVPGDIVLIEGGNAVPADLRLYEAHDLTINESALTGEWVPVPKEIRAVGASARANEQVNMAWSGTNVVTGYGKGIVIATGMQTAFGKIADDTAQVDTSATPLQRGVAQVARVLTMVIGVGIVVIIALGLLRGEPLAEMVLVGIAVAVAAIPSGLPAAVTVVLAIGMEAILRRGGLVRNLLAAETLGSTTIILTDKTGTLTEGVMSVSSLYTARSIDANDSSVAHPDNHALLEAAVLSSGAFVAHDEKGNPQVHGRPIEKAVVVAGLSAGISQPELFAHGHERIDYLQFQSSRRFSASLNAHNNETRLYVSGSPEQLLALSQKYFVAGTAREFDAEMRATFEAIQQRESAEGQRLIAMAYRPHPPHDQIPQDIKDGNNPSDLVFLGLIVFSDTVRSDVHEEINRAKDAGMRVVMVTGDYPETARAVALQTGIATENDKAITGSEIEDMDDAQLLQQLRSSVIFARVLPAQKLRIAHVLKSADEVVAMTGDGVNDAPALVAANIGVAVESGTDVAKEASDIILLRNAFSTITGAVAEGRRAVGNLRKIIAYLLSTSFSEVIVIGGALAAGAPLPLLPTQILWANLVEEGFMSFPFAFEPAEKGIMKQSPRVHSSRRVITPPIRRIIFIVTAITGTLLLALFFFLRSLGLPIEEIRTVMFVALSLDSILFALSFKDLHKPVWRIELFNNVWVFAGLAASITLLIAALTIEPLRALLSLVPLNTFDLALLAALGVLNLGTIELVKWFANRK